MTAAQRLSRGEAARPPVGADGPLTVRMLAAALASAVAVVTEGDGVDRRVRELAIWEPEPPTTVGIDDVVVAIGVAPAHVEAVWRHACAGGAAAVVMRAAAARTLPDTSEGPSVLAVEQGVGWDAFLAAAAAVLKRESWRGPAAPLGDLFAFADALAAAIGGPVVIDDHQLRLRAYSTLPQPLDHLRLSSIVARKAPAEELDRLRREGALARVWQTDDVVRLSGFAGARDRLAIRVRAGSEILGVIFVAESGAALGDEAAVVLRHAADIAAAHLLQAARRSSDRDHPDLAGRAALDGTRVPAGSRGLPPAGAAYRVVAVGSGSGSDGRRALVELVRMRLRAGGWSAVSVDGASTVYAVVGDAQPAQALKETAERITRDGERLTGGPVWAAIGSAARDADAIARSRRDADQLLRLAADEASATFTFEEHRHRAFLLELQELDAVRHYAGSAAVHSMADHDRAHGTAYVETVRAYLDALANASVAAEALHVHHNTVRYRMAQAKLRFGLDLDDPVERLVTQLELHFLTAAAPA